MQENIVDRFFIKYFLIIYYLYIMSVNVLFPKGSMVGILVNGVILLFLLYASFIRNRHNGEFVLVYVYLIFILLLILLQSSNVMYSFTNYIKYALGLLCLPIGFNILSSVRKLREFQKTGFAFLILYLTNLILANIFHLGDYYGYKVEGGMEIGNVFADGLYANAYVIVSLSLLLLLFPTKKKQISLLLAIGTILIIVNMKRTVILVLAVGLIIYLSFYYLNNGIKFKFAKIQLRHITLFLLFALSVLPFFYNEIQLRLDNREKTFQQANEDITNEGRISELIYISDEILHADKLSTLLMGKETLNYVGTYAGGLFGERQIHGDYAKILHGTGVLGVLIWSIIHLYLVVWMIRMKRKVSHQSGIVASIIYPLFFAFFIMYLFSMISGVSGLVVSSAFFYASIGGFLRYFYNRQYLIKKRYYESINSRKL